jgi:hypothetical protein
MIPCKVGLHCRAQELPQEGNASYSRLSSLTHNLGATPFIFTKRRREKII